VSNFLSAVHDLAPVLVVGVFIGMAAYVATVIISDLADEADRLADLLLAGDWDDEPTPLFDQMADEHPWITAQLDRAEFEASVLADVAALPEVSDR
jgi:hypothetical protein